MRSPVVPGRIDGQEMFELESEVGICVFHDPIVVNIVGYHVSEVVERC